MNSLRFINRELPSLKNWNVILLGENHFDPSRLTLLSQILRSVATPNLTLSLEFWDRSSQPVINEYLSGLIDEETFIRDSSPPSNYKDYLSLINFCKVKKLRVIGSNTPRRYSKMVRKFGPAVLEKLDDVGKTFVPQPLNYAPPCEGYAEAFKDMMGVVGKESMNSEKISSMLDAQNLWDATMAHGISMELGLNQKVLHISGYFHVARGLGILEHLKKYSPRSEVLSIITIPRENYEEYCGISSSENLADYVVLTND